MTIARPEIQAPAVDSLAPIPEPKPSIFENRWVQRAIVWGGLAVLWEIIGIVLGPFYFPRFSEVITAVFGTFTNGDFLTVVGSLRQMLSGFALAAVVGVVLGLLIGSSKYAEYVLGIYVNALFVTSLEALLPFLIILFGTEFQFRVAVVFLFALFHIIINTTAGVRSVSRDLLETAAAFCTPRHKVFTKIMLPAALPYVIVGLRLGLGHAVKGMVIAELWVTVDTGRRLVDLGLSRNLPEFFAIALLIVLAGVLSTQFLLLVQKWITPWATDIMGHGQKASK